MQNYSLPGGILSIVSGVLGFIFGVGCAVLWTYMARLMFFQPYMYRESGLEEMYWIITGVYAGFGGLWAILGIVAIVGGVYGYKKKAWPMALAGAIAATITFFPCGIAAVIFISMSRPEFHSAAQPSSGQYHILETS